MATNLRYKQSAAGLGTASNGTTAVLLYTFGTGLKGPDGATGPGGILDRCRIYNADTVAHVVELHLVPPSDAVDYDTLIERITIGSGEVYVYIGGERVVDSFTLYIKLGEPHTTRPVYAVANVSEVY